MDENWTLMKIGQPGMYNQPDIKLKKQGGRNEFFSSEA